MRARFSYHSKEGCRQQARSESSSRGGVDIPVHDRTRSHEAREWERLAWWGVVRGGRKTLGTWFLYSNVKKGRWISLQICSVDLQSSAHSPPPQQKHIRLLWVLNISREALLRKKKKSIKNISLQKYRYRLWKVPMQVRVPEASVSLASW